jgi:UDP-N-acetylmuramate dehydrogenase
MINLQENFPLLHYNTFGIAANTKFFFEPKDEFEIQEFLGSPWAEVRPRFVLGGGSNVLFTKDYEGVVIHPLIRGLEIVSETKEMILIRAGAGENWDSFVEHCVNNNLGGVENLSLIPGTIGACPVQNIGAYGIEVGDVIHSVDGINLEDGKNFTLSAEECGFSYRDSIFKRKMKDKVIILYVTFKLQKHHAFKTSYPDLKKELDKYSETTIKTIRDAVISVRKNKLPDPDITGNAGSFFKNPVVQAEKILSLRIAYPAIPAFNYAREKAKLSAAWLIEQSGWKGRQLGKTGTYKKQPLIIVNHGGATGDEILNCAQKIQKAVLNRFAIKLEMEVNVL